MNIEVWQEGRLAYLDGFDKHCNPYPTTSHAYYEWNTGFDSAYDDYEEFEGELQ